jgi:peptidyl-prolyl cis-trans isomerase C
MLSSAQGEEDCAMIFHRHFTVARRHSPVALALVLVGMVMSACGGPTPLNGSTVAAVVNGHNISMQLYYEAVRFYYQTNIQQNPGQTTWQNPASRDNLVQSQQGALRVLVMSELLNPVIAQLERSNQLKASSLTEQAFFASLPPSQLQQLQQQITTYQKQGIFPSDLEHALLYNIILNQDVIPLVTTPVAHIKILTVKDKAKANSLLQQLNSGKDWATLAQQNSIDPAQQTGGEVSNLPQYVFPDEIDKVIFGKGVKTNVIQGPIQSKLGYSLVEVSDVKATQLKDLDNTGPMFPNVQFSAQNAGVSAYLINLEKNAHVDIKVNWCLSISGQNCGPLTQPINSISG